MDPGPVAFAAAAAEAGVATARVAGAGPRGWLSWNGFGSNESPGSDGSTCADNSPEYCSVFSECPCRECVWTTCVDSVGIAMAALDLVESEYCVDSDRVWAMGCSNGGMFTFELAHDQRSAPRLAGVLPVVGLPHNGFNFGPSSPMHFLGMWGSKDHTCPPFSNTEDPSKSFDTDYEGWYYSTAANTTRLWACNEDTAENTLASLEDGCGNVGKGCGNTGDVRACVFDAGHVCNLTAHHEMALDFILPRSKPRSRGDDNDGGDRAAIVSIIFVLSLLVAVLLISCCIFGWHRRRTRRRRHAKSEEENGGAENAAEKRVDECELPSSTQSLALV